MPNSDCKRNRRVIASFITNSNDPDRKTWDLTAYQTAGLGKPGGTWRLVEAGAGLVYEHGKIAPDGTLVSNDFVFVDNGVNWGGGGGGSGGGEGGLGGAGTPTPSGVPDDFTTSYDYDGYMELEVEDPEEECPCPELEECCEKC